MDRTLRRVALAMGLLVSTTAIADDVTPPIRVFTSAPGAFSVRIPAGWFVKEIPSPETYEGYFSREKIDVAGDIYTYGLNVVRLRDYKTKFGLQAKSNRARAREYVDRYAAKLDMFGNPEVKIVAGNLPGMEAWSFELLVNVGTPSCVWTRIIVGIYRKEWFHAMWEVPCDQRTEKEAEIESMAQSLEVSTSWGEAP